MHRSTPGGFSARLSSERGVALPLALLGLVLVSLLVTSALLSSSTEVEISMAHQGGTASLHGVDGALQRYVATKAAGAAAGSDSLFPVQQDASLPSYLVTVARLHSDVDTLSSGALQQRETFSLLAEQADGRGRRVNSLITSLREVDRFRVDVQAGLTVGGNVQVTGSSTISDGRNASCDSAAAPNALQVTAGSTITRSGSSVIEGRADTASYGKEEMVRLLLGGTSLRDAARLANIKFAVGEFNGRVRSYDSSGPRPKTDKYNWGCPQTSSDACNTVTGNEVNRSYYPIVAIDAGGGKVTIEGNHGQGILIVYNGSAELRGNLVYQGVLLVEQDLTVQGTGGSGGVKLEGAVVAFGENSSVQDNVSGNAVITYNRCVIAAATAGMDQQRLASAQQQFPSPTFGWVELVR